jgi:hypothetical protein
MRAWLLRERVAVARIRVGVLVFHGSLSLQSFRLQGELVRFAEPLPIV